MSYSELSVGDWGLFFKGVCGWLSLFVFLRGPVTNCGRARVVTLPWPHGGEEGGERVQKMDGWMELMNR